MPPTAPPPLPLPGNAYQQGPASSDRSTRCGNRNGVWPPLYKRQWEPHPARSLARTAQRRWQRCVHDAVAAGELHRTTGAVLLAFCRASDDRLEDVWIAQATVAERLGLAESTVCHHMTIARRSGWIAVQHRNRLDNGLVLAMTNVTRFELPASWREQLERQDRDRTARQQKQRRGRTTQAGTRHHQPAGEPSHPTLAQQAASGGAGVARSAATLSFEQGREEIEQQFRGQPELYEAAYDSFVETWKKVRLIE